MKNYRLLQTDYYQIPMVFAFVLLNKANERTGYEGFYRHVKHAVNPNMDFYVFDGETEVHEYIKTIKKELKNKSKFIEKMWFYLKNKVDNKFKDEFFEKAQNLDTNFEYNVVKNGTFVFPGIPVFQYIGPRWIGQLIETAVTNCYNGRTGFATVKYLKKHNLGYITENDLKYLKDIMTGNTKSKNFKNYINDLNIRAKEYRSSTNKILLEAAARRAPTFLIGKLAAEIALKNGWQGSSNTAIFDHYEKFIGGTMAHAFVQAFETEAEAFEKWNDILEDSTNLIDTTDTIIGAETVLKGKKLPKEVRIDSGDLIKLTFQVHDMVKDYGLEVYPSGDISPELLIEFERIKLPFKKTMAGSKFVYCNELIKKVNSGFVYKIVWQENKNNYPLKMAPGKQNYPGLKRIEQFGNNFIVRCVHNEKPDISKSDFFKIDTVSKNKLMFVETEIK